MESKSCISQCKEPVSYFYYCCNRRLYHQSLCEGDVSPLIKWPISLHVAEHSLEGTKAGTWLAAASQGEALRVFSLDHLAWRNVYTEGHAKYKGM